MLKSLDIKNFTVFADAKIEFSPGLNVVIGDNATGKSHLLKLGYSIMHTLSQLGRHKDSGNISAFIEAQLIVSLDEIENHLQPSAVEDLKKFLQQKRAKEYLDEQAFTSVEQLQIQLGDKLNGVFKPDSLSHLCRHPRSAQPTQVTINLTTKEGADNVLFSFVLNNSEVIVPNLPLPVPKQTPLFFPTREVLTLQPAFTVLYENRYLSMSETHYDLCKALSLPLLKKCPTDIKEIIKPLEAELGGFVTVDKTGHFYLDRPEQGKVEFSLIAEGFRKMAMLVYLILNGSIKKGSTLFWDETEVNLNPKIMVKVAKALAVLAQKGVQVILATHDLFLMKELSLLVETSEIPARFFSLKRENDSTTVEQGHVLEDLPTIVTLEEELALYDREQAAYYAKKAINAL